jgi:uncharacterized Ntn-hydrolase superfamily protein
MERVMRIAPWVVCALIVSTPAYATFSIVAIDPATGDIGVAMGSMAFGASARVPFGEGGVGVIATQANNNVGYQMRSLELLKSGLTAAQVLERLLAEDTFPGKEGRQVVLLDAKGNIAVYQGPNAPGPAANRQRQTYAVIGNNVLSTHVVDAMGAAFENSTGELAERLYAALKGAADAGGDRTSAQSAAILVFRKQFDNNDRYVSVRVDSHVDPIHEIRRLLDLQLARNYQGTRNHLVRSGKIAEALAAAEKAVGYEPTVADNHLHAGFLRYLAGERAQAMQAFTRARQLNPSFKQSWDAVLKNAQFRTAYQRVGEDLALASSVLH